MAGETEDAVASEDQGVTEDITSLSDVFNESEETEEAEATEETTEEKGEAEEEETEETQETESKAAEPPSAEESGLKAALSAERRKRQEAEEKLKKFEVQGKVPDPVEDPEGYAKHIETVSSTNRLNDKIALSRDIMVDAKEDYPAMEKVFMSLVGEYDEDGKLSVVNDESLLRKFQQSSNPCRFAYNHAKEHLEIQKLRDPKYKETLAAEIREQVRKELEAELKGKKASAVDLPDLTRATEAGKNSTKVEKLSELDEIFADSKL